MWNLKRHLGSLLVGALVVGGVAYVGAGALTSPSQDVVLTQQNDAPEGEQAGRGSRHKKGFGLRGAIRGELVVPGDEEGTFKTIRIDRGVLARVDGSTVVINEDDGTSVDIATSDGTRISRDGSRATLGDLKEGDHIRVLRVKEGDGFVTQSVHAISPERWEQRQQRRQRRSEAEPRTG